MLKAKQKKKNHNKIVMLTSNKLNSKISEALINNKNSYENFTTIIDEKKTIVNLKKALKWWKL